MNVEQALTKVDYYCQLSRASEVEMGVKSDVSRGRVPKTWYGILKRLNWDAEKFKQQLLKEIQDGKNNENVQGSSGDGEDTRSDSPDAECGRGHVVDSCPEGCSEGECEHPRTD